MRPNDKCSRSVDSGTDVELTDVYETRDFYLACFLRTLGYKLIALKPEGRRRVFVFCDRIGRTDDVIAFYGDRATVPPLLFSRTIKDMKALLHNA